MYNFVLQNEFFSMILDFYEIFNLMLAKSYLEISRIGGKKCILFGVISPESI